jgi:hypothetical protein
MTLMARKLGSIARITLLAFGLVLAGVSTVDLPAPAGAQTKKAAKKPAKKGEAKAGEAEEGAAAEEAEGRVVGADAGAKKSGGGPAVVDVKTQGDGGIKTYKFGPVDVEGRLKSPQVVYFLRRVRAEFAAGDLGHRSFMRELSHTRQSPAIR